MPLSRTRPLAAAVLMLLIAPALLAPLSSAGSHTRLVVVLWNESAEGAAANDTLVVWAEVFDAGVRVNVTSVTFYWGLHFPPFVFAIPYAGSYAGSPGRYNASVILAQADLDQGVNILSVEVVRGAERATSSRFVVLADSLLAGPGGGGGGPWTVHAGVENVAELGTHVEPGETLVWRVETKDNGTLADAASLTADLYEAPLVMFTETPTAITPQRIGVGIYEVAFTVPPSLTESRQYILQAHISETNDAWSNGTADVWFHDTVVDFAEANNAWLAGTLTVGDGVDPESGLAVALQITTAAAPPRSIGWINGTTDAAGRVSFNVTNDGTNSLVVDGWVNGSSTQRVYRPLLVRDLFVQAAPDAGRFDAVAIQDTSAVPWAGTATIAYEFWNNGTRHASSWVHAYAHSARGLWMFANLTTDAQGVANVTLDFDAAPPFAFDDLDFAAAVGGDIHALVNITFRTPVGPDASVPDGRWWGEDEETIQADPLEALLTQFADTNVALASEDFVKGARFGVASQYNGAKDPTAWEAAAVLTPGSFVGSLAGIVERYAVWTGSDFPFVSYMRQGTSGEFFGCGYVPSYWPGTDYTLASIQLPSLGDLTSEEGPPTAGALGWTSVVLGSPAAGFVPAADAFAPDVYGVGDLSVDLGQSLDLSASAYDDSLDFCAVGNYTWSFTDPSVGLIEVYGASATVMLPSPGVVPATLTVQDNVGNSVVVPFNVTVTDVTAPTIDAGADQLVYTGTLVNFSAAASDNDPFFPAGASFNWAFTYNGSTVNLAGETASFMFDIAGAYDVTLTVADGGGNMATDTVRVAVRIPDFAAPTIDAGPDQTVFAGTVVTFAGSATDNDPAFPAGASFRWTFAYNGSPVSLSGQGAAFTFGLVGSYLVTFEVSDGSNNTATDALRVDVLPPDTVPPVVRAGADIVVTEGAMVTLTGDATDNDAAFPAGANITWSFVYGGSPRTFTGFSFTHQFSIVGSYTVTLTVEDAAGNVGLDELTVMVRAPDSTPPGIQPIADMQVLTGVLVNLVANATDDSPDFAALGRYNWTFTHAGQAYDLSGANASFTFTTAEVVAVTLTVTDGSGNSATEAFQVRVRALDTTPPTIVLAQSNVTARVGEPVALSAAAADGGNPIVAASAFVWSFTEGTTPHTYNGGLATHTFQTPGTYAITLRVTDAAGNVATATMHVVVSEGTPGPTSPTGLDPLLLVGILLAFGVLGVLAWMAMRKRGTPQDESRPPQAARSEEPKPPQ